MNYYQFPFGEKVRRVEQQDKTKKRVFVLGVYASAVHAKWVKSKKTVCQALAIASEPYIFWDGDKNEAQQIINNIIIPPELGTLILPDDRFNGPSGKVLNEKILKPLRVTRGNTWLCDLLPESRLNENQKKTIVQKYNPLIEKFEIDEVTVPFVSRKFCDGIRREEITKEILEAKPEILVLLGNEPIQQYLKYVCDTERCLQDFVEKYGYGNPIPSNIDGFNLKIVPIAHPTHIGKFRTYSNNFYYSEHRKWEKEVAPLILSQ